MHSNMIFALFLATIFSRGFGQEFHVNLLSFENCVSKLDELNFNLSIAMVEDLKWMVTSTAQAEQVIDLNELEFVARIFAKKRDSYMEVTALQGHFCDLVKNVMGAEWDRIRSAVVPEFGKQCEIEPGTYELNYFELNLDNSNLRSYIPSGRQMKVVIEVNSGKDTLACAVFEFINEEI